MERKDLEYMELALDQARKSEAEDETAKPKVGAVLVKDGEVLAKAYRGEISPGDHAEFTILEKKLKDNDLAGSTMYTTLEPCTTRNDPKVPCAQRLIERKIGKVYIGQLDPNPTIQGEGILRLRESQISVQLFEPEIMVKIEDLNREFTREQRKKEKYTQSINTELITELSSKSLDDWYVKLNTIYWNKNYSKTSSDIFTHLSEIVGGLSLLASQKDKEGVEPQSYLAKTLAWWLAICGKVGVSSVADLIWTKFPYVCCYCHKKPHDPTICTEKKEQNEGIDWEKLHELGTNTSKPQRISEWQRMFSDLYPAQQTENYSESFARLTEELGELAEAIRVFDAVPGYFISEAADVFAWLMHIQNIYDTKNKVKAQDRGQNLEEAMVRAYPDGCKDCKKRLCSCPPILDATVGRITHEVPTKWNGNEDPALFWTSDKLVKKFRSNDWL